MGLKIDFMPDTIFIERLPDEHVRAAGNEISHTEDILR